MISKASLDKIVIEPEQICAIVMQLNSRNRAAYWPKVPGLSGIYYMPFIS